MAYRSNRDDTPPPSHTHIHPQRALQLNSNYRQVLATRDICLQLDAMRLAFLYDMREWFLWLALIAPVYCEILLRKFDVNIHRKLILGHVILTEKLVTCERVGKRTNGPGNVDGVVLSSSIYRIYVVLCKGECI
ncbi:hypothetical protein LOAG_04724 [Loa loa]|uniref:Uncharacterized protein n=1 Tax=Loa loa TaxID=7209 RepID=A0A1S0U1J0_LOALO|nr:hypothetical protein LOAG_04724 [Loa loa]EFO23761.2 hypothetical protein LOAG_04724 [Loa loa]